MTLWTFHSPDLGGGDLPTSVKAFLGTVHVPVSPTDYRLGMLLLGGRGFGHAFAQCPDSALEAGSGAWAGARFKPHSGMTWARLISSLNCCRQKGIFSFSLTFLFSLSLLLSIIEHLEGYF